MSHIRDVQSSEHEASRVLLRLNRTWLTSFSWPLEMLSENAIDATLLFTHSSVLTGFVSVRRIMCMLPSNPQLAKDESSNQSTSKQHSRIVCQNVDNTRALLITFVASILHVKLLFLYIPNTNIKTGRQKPPPRLGELSGIYWPLLRKKRK